MFLKKTNNVSSSSDSATISDKMRFTAILPLLLTLGAFIISMLCLFAGSKPGFMETYDIVTLNASTLGFSTDDPSPTSTSASASATATSTSGRVKNWLTDKASNLTDKLGDEWDEITDDLQDAAADKLAEALGIREWYSLHIMDMCMGYYAPNATAEDAGKNVTSCTPRKAMYKFDPTGQLEEQLASGPFGGKITLEDLGYPDAIQDGINSINALLQATFIFYVLGIAFAGILILTSIASIFRTGRILSLLNVLLSFLSFLCLGIGSAILTAFMVKAAKLINDYGNEVGLYANRGNKFLALTWAAAGAMFLSWLAWIVLFILGRNKHGLGSEKKAHVQG